MWANFKRSYIDPITPALLKYLPLVTLIASIIVYGAGALLDWQQLKTLGYTIFASAIFASLLKAYQFQGIFREDLEQIVYSEKYFNTLKEPAETLGTLMQGLLKKRFPEWPEAHVNLVLGEYLPTRYSFYMEDIQRELVVTQDESDGDVLQLVDKITCKYFPDSTGGPHIYNLPATIRDAALPGEQFYDEVEIELDGVDMTAHIQAEEVKREEISGKRQSTYNRWLELPNLQSGRVYYDMTRVSKRRQDIEKDPHMRVYAQTFVKGISLTLKGLE